MEKWQVLNVKSNFLIVIMTQVYLPFTVNWRRQNVKFHLDHIRIRNKKHHVPKQNMLIDLLQSVVVSGKVDSALFSSDQ